MPKQPLFKNEWELYRKNVLPPNVSPVQLRETRRAFYAGAIAMLSTVQKLGEDEWTEEEGANALDALSQECANFASQVGKKY